MSATEGPFIRVKFYDKIQSRQGVNLFQFRVITHAKSQPEIKMLVKYSEI